MNVEYTKSCFIKNGYLKHFVLFLQDYQNLLKIFKSRVTYLCKHKNNNQNLITVSFKNKYLYVIKKLYVKKSNKD